MVELRTQIKKEINANIVKPIIWSDCKNSRLAVKRAKLEFRNQNFGSQTFVNEKSENISVIVNHASKNNVKFNAVFISK